MQADLPGLSESVARTTIQLRVAKDLIDRQWNAIQEERCRLVEETERFSLEKEAYEREKRLFEVERDWMNKNIVEDVVSLCVGGKHMATSRSTLISREGSMLSAMFSGRHKLARSADDSIFLDRDPEPFRYVLDYLRTDKLCLPNPETQPGIFQAVLDEFDYFCVPLPSSQSENLSESQIQWGNVATSETLVSDSPCSIECIKVVGDIILCGRYDGMLEAWSLSAKKQLKKIKTEHETLFSIEAIGNTVFTAGSGTSHICVWDLNTQAITAKLTGHLQDVRALKLWNNILISGSNDHTVKVWDVVTGKCITTLEGHDGDVTSVDFDGELIISGSEDCSVRVWNFRTKTCQGMFAGHFDKVSSVSLYRGKFVVSGSPDGTLRLWNVATGDCERTIHIGFAACVWGICVSGDYVVCGCDENIKVWNLASGNPVTTLAAHQDHVWGVQVVDSLLVSCSEDCTVRVWRQNDSETPKSKKSKTKRRTVLSDEESFDEFTSLNDGVTESR